MQSSVCLITGLYVHVPFCARKCAYCAFYSHAPDGDLTDRYVRCLIREMQEVARDLKPETIFFGGGTPSLLTLRHWKDIMTAMDALNLRGAGEFTVECNPATVSLDKAHFLKDSGVNRISMGVQSFDSLLLERLGRIHSRAQIFKSFDILRAAGFDNINVDLMFAIPGQSMTSWRQTLAEGVAMGTEHLSSYELIYEEDTLLFQELQAGLVSPDEDLASAMYEELVACTDRAGFKQYEIANFARGGPGPSDTVPRYACQHNLRYWNGSEFYGLGPGASEYVRGVRRTHFPNTTSYCEQLERGQRPTQASDPLPPLQRAGEIAAFGLRRNAGWDRNDFYKATGFDLFEHWPDEINETLEEGWGTVDGENFKLTPQGLRFADLVGSRFLR